MLCGHCIHSSTSKKNQVVTDKDMFVYTLGFLSFFFVAFKFEPCSMFINSREKITLLLFFFYGKEKNGNYNSREIVLLIRHILPFLWIRGLKSLEKDILFV